MAKHHSSDADSGLNPAAGGFAEHHARKVSSSAQTPGAGLEERDPVAPGPRLHPRVPAVPWPS